MKAPLYFFEPTPATTSSFFRSLQRLPRWVYGLIGVAFSLAASVGLAVFLVGPLAASLVKTGDPKLDSALSIMLTFTPYWLMLLIYGIAKKSVRGTGFTARHAVRHLLLGLLLGFVFSLLCNVVPGLFGGGFSFQTNLLGDPAFWLGFLLWLAVAFVQGGGEEVLFRGLVPRFLGRTLSAGMVVFLSTIAFGAAHSFVPNNVIVIMIFSTVLGAVFGLVELLTNSAWLTVGFHTTFNLVSLYLASGATTALFAVQQSALTGIVAIGLPVVLVVVLVLVLNKKRPGWHRERIGAAASAPAADEPVAQDA